MKGKYKQNKKRKAGNVVLKKYMVAVGEFVKSKAGSDEAESEHELGFVKKKSRKELRKEKRKMKKAKMKSYYEGKGGLVAPGSDGEKCGTPGDKQQQRKKVEKAQKEAQKTPVNKASHAPAHNTEHSKAQTKAKKVNKLQESRKMALLEANEEEDREIKRLERFLGLNKRKNKKNLPQSFVADGLDYILGVIDSGSSAVGTYDSDGDMDMAKENFEKLDQNDPRLSDEDEEPGDEMASEGSGEDMGSLDEEEEEEDKDDDNGDDDDEMEDEEEAEEEDVPDGSDAAESDGETEDLSEREEEALDTTAPGSTTENVS